MFFCGIILILDGVNSLLWSKSRSGSEYCSNVFFFAACQIGLVISNSIWLLPIWLEPVNVVLYAVFLCVKPRGYFPKVQPLHGIVVAGIATITVRYILNHQLVAGESFLMYGAILAGLLGLGLAGFLLADDVLIGVWYMFGAAAGAFLFFSEPDYFLGIVYCNLVWCQLCLVQVWTTCSHILMARVSE
jgi:hypothetical protein